MAWPIWFGLALGTIAALVIGLGVYGAARWANSTRRLLINLDHARVPYFRATVTALTYEYFGS